MIELKITGIGKDGDGLSMLENGDPVFVDNGLDGETVKAELYDTKSPAKRAKIIDFIKKSDHRQNAPCPHYSKCGGCQLQHMEHEYYKSWKEQIIKDLIETRLDQKLSFLPTYFTDTGTRRRASFACLKTKNDLIIGYNQKRSKHIQNIDECLILLPELLDVKESLRPFLNEILSEGKVVDLFLQKVNNDDQGYDMVLTGFLDRSRKHELTLLQTLAEIIQNTKVARISWRLKERDYPEKLIEKNALFTHFGQLNVKLPPLAFMQPSLEGENHLSAQMLQMLQSTDTDIKNIADLFSGNGTFTGQLLKSGYNVTAYEIDKQATANLKRSGFTSCEQRDLFKEPITCDVLNTYDRLVLDPPRAGAKSQCMEIAKSDLNHFVYISCNPISFSRDATILSEGGYKINQIQLVDQFPWTTHMELIALLSRK